MKRFFTLILISLTSILRSFGQDPCYTFHLYNAGGLGTDISGKLPSNPFALGPIPTAGTFDSAFVFLPGFGVSPVTTTHFSHGIEIWDANYWYGYLMAGEFLGSCSPAVCNTDHSGMFSPVFAGITTDSLLINNTFYAPDFAGQKLLFISTTYQSLNIWTRVFRFRDVLNAASLSGVSCNSFNNGDILVSGQYTDTLIIDNDTLYSGNPMTPAIFMIRMDANGNVLWAKTSTSSPNSYAYCWDMKITYSGAIVLCGDYYGSVNFSGTTSGSTPTSSYTKAPFVASFDGSGNCLFINTGTTAATGTISSALAIAADSYGNIYSGGHINAQIDFNGTILTGNDEAYLQKLDASGNQIWAKLKGGHIGSGPEAITAMDFGDYYIGLYYTGVFSDSTNIGTTPFTSRGGQDVFFVNTDTSGTPVSASTIGSSGYDNATGISSPFTGPYITGTFNGSMLYCDSDSIANFNPGTYDIFVYSSCFHQIEGINTISESAKLSLFPNPATGILNVSFPEFTSTNTNLIITNPEGKIVKQFNIPSNAEFEHYPINISDLAPGYYLLHMAGTKVLAHGRFVKTGN